MKHKRSVVADYFTFSKKQRNAIFIALFLIAISLIFRFSYHYFIAEKTVMVDSSFFKQVAALKSADTNRYANNYKPYKRNNYNDEADYNKPYEKKEYNNAKGELFAFDPNTATTDEWKRLGIRDKTIATIQHYLEKGGKFRKPEDIKKVYGIFPEQAERLLPYVKIKAIASNFNDRNEKNDVANVDKPFHEPYAKPTYQPKQIDVNAADTTAFISLPGIGSKLANRIVSYRDKLGGFYKIEQLGETYGIADSVFQKIKPRLVLGNSAVKQINVNTADAVTLKGNPYIRWNIANAIFQYKQQHGNYSSVADIKKIMLIDELTFNKISPYLTVQ